MVKSNSAPILPKKKVKTPKKKPKYGPDGKPIEEVEEIVYGPDNPPPVPKPPPPPIKRPCRKCGHSYTLGVLKPWLIQKDSSHYQQIL